MVNHFSKTFQKLIILSFTLSCLISSSVFAETELSELPEDIRDLILEKLEESKQFSEDQLEVVSECLSESNTKEVLNCFSDGGFDRMDELLTTMVDQLDTIQEKICGEKKAWNKDNCEQTVDKFAEMTKQFKNTWVTTFEKGKRFFEENNRLFFMKRKICKRIEQKGCYAWLNERINIKCKQDKFIGKPEKLKECQMDVVDDVWARLNKT